MGTVKTLKAKLIVILIVFMILFSNFGFTLSAIATSDEFEVINRGFFRKDEIKFDAYFEELKHFYPSVEFAYFQSNVEGEMINKIHEVGFEYDGIILNDSADNISGLFLHKCYSDNCKYCDFDFLKRCKPGVQ